MIVQHVGVIFNHNTYLTMLLILYATCANLSKANAISTSYE